MQEKMTKVLSCLVMIATLMTVVQVLVVDANAQQQEENTWVEIVQAPNNIAACGDVVFHGNALYIMSGGSSKEFWKLDLTSESWTTLQNLPDNVGDMTFDGQRYIYYGLMPSQEFWRYDINKNIWVKLPDTPEGACLSGSICYANEYVYLRPGTRHSMSFYRYSTSSQIWEIMATGPRVALLIGPRSAMTYDGIQYIYTFQGGDNIEGTLFDDIWRYDTWNDQWLEIGHHQQLSRADLVYVDGGLFALNEGIANFGFFDLSNNNWVRKQDVPCGLGFWNYLGPGASLAYDGTQYIYALNGGNNKRIYRYCVGDKPIDFDINVAPEENRYDLGETAKVTIDITNNRDQDTEIWLGITFQDPEGNEYDIPLEHAEVLKDETKSFDVDWTIPKNAPLGQYWIAVNCWKDEAQTGKYADELEWELIFNVYNDLKWELIWELIFNVCNLDILSPTSSSPVIVGDPSTPAEFNAEVSTGIPFILNLPDAFNAMIGNKPAGVTVIPSFFDNAFGYYTLQITPPNQDIEDSYDLNIGFSVGEVSDYDVESDAVIYLLVTT